MDVAELLEKAEAIRLDEIDQARFKGGLQAATKMARSLLRDGYSIEKIAEYTELPTSEILALQADFPQTP